MKIKKEQRLGVFVDVQNMYYSARNLYNSKVNFGQILKEAVNDRSLVRAMAYVIKADIKEEKNFFEALSKIGYEIKSKDLQTFAGGAKKGDWDVGIAMDAIELAPKLDTIVLVSGDGDFVPLVQHLRRALGCRIEVMAFGKSGSKNLKEEADEFIDMDKAKRRFLISR
ncbi:NYN domain-containing protein [Candidatus Woesearchaeota archaeon]|nr:NYN domain-containing protein [Candidatus Woesearchaeota archaeon]